MGYETYFQLKIEPDNEEDLEKFKEEIEKIPGYSYIFEGERVTWYDHEKHMREFSKLYPNVLFKLYGEGEEFGDGWYEYYQNGLMQRCEAVITYPPYNKELMK